MGNLKITVESSSEDSDDLKKMIETPKEVDKSVTR